MRRSLIGCLLLLLLIVVLAASSRPASTLGPSDMESADTELIATADTMITSRVCDEYTFHGHKVSLAIERGKADLQLCLQ